MKKIQGFSLIELSIVILIIGLVIAGVIVGNKLVTLSNLSRARTLTTSSPVAGTEDLALWLETTSKDSFTSILNDGDNLSTWKDINPQLTVKNNASQNDSDKQPNYVTNSINGLPVIKFNGIATTGDALIGGIINLNNSYTIFSVLKQPDATSGGAIFAIFNGTPSRMHFYVLDNGSIRVRTASDNLNFIGRTAPAGTVSINTPTIISATYDGGLTSSSVKIYKNGVQVDNGNDIGGTFTGLTPTTLPYEVGAQSGGTFNNSGPEIGELIFYTRNLGDLERQQIEQYLSKKWGVKLS